ncbi:IclR family transcriptional regulator [Streptomyces sp. NPDC002144]
MTSAGRPRDTSVQSVDRAVSILQSLSRRGPSGVTELAAALGLHKATVFRLLATLESRGLVEQDTERGRYRLGFGMVELAAGAGRQSDLSLLSRPVCRELAAAVGETVNLAIHDGLEVITIDQEMGGATISSIDWVGKRSPLHATAAGKLFLAHMPEEQADEVLGRGLVRYTPHTITEPALLKAELRTVRERGYATTSQEHEIGLAAIAAPIHDLDGRIVAAVTVSGPTFRLDLGADDETVPALAEQVRQAGERISVRQGHRPQV